MNRLRALLGLGILLLGGCSPASPTEASPSPTPSSSQSPSPTSTPTTSSPIGIADFDSGTDGMPDGWDVEQWVDRSEFVWEQAGSCRTGRCVSIETTHSEGNDARWTQTFQLTPEGWYNLSGWIKGDELQNTSGDVAANISVGDEWLHSDGLLGTFGWTKVDMTFQADETGKAKIGCRLGFWGSEATGKAYFDDLEITPLEVLEGQHHYLILEPTDVLSSGISDEHLAQWQARLDQAYDAYAELVGDVPYGGDKIAIASVRQYPGGWAVAGNPIQWYQPYIADTLRTIDTEDEWSFGILHELGHDFDLDYRWAWDVEMMANLKLEYVVETLDAIVIDEGRPLQGEEVREIFASDYADARSQGEYNWAVIHVRFAELRDEYGWEPFKQVFRVYPQVGDPDCPASRLDKFLLFIDLLSESTGEDVKSLFEPGEWDWMIDDLSV